MVHYYQPDHPKLYLNVTITDGIADDPERGDQGAGAVIVPDFPVYQAVLPLPTCTDHQGCRSGVLRNPGDRSLGSSRSTRSLTSTSRTRWVRRVNMQR